MKKGLLVICLCLCVFMLFGCSSNNPATPTEAPTEAPTAEPFNLRDGVQFGMSKAEAIEIEKKNGISFEETTDWNNYFPKDVLRIDSEPTTVAGRDYSTITYMFDDNGNINAMLYIADDFMSESIKNEKVLAALNEKYGEPVGNNGKIVPFEGKAYDALAVALNYKDKHPKDNPRYDLFYQWLVPQADGSCVDIQFLMMGFPSVVNYRIISYSYRSVEEANALYEKNMKENESINNDL